VDEQEPASIGGLLGADVRRDRWCDHR
jgi:hypothetical protein